MPRDQLIGDVVEIAADDLRLRADGEHVIAGSLDQRRFPAGRDPAFQDYFRTHKPAVLAVWGRNDPFFLPPGAEAFKRDIPNAKVRFFDTGHFALETHAPEIANAIRDFLS